MRGRAAPSESRSSGGWQALGGVERSGDGLAKHGRSGRRRGCLPARRGSESRRSGRAEQLGYHAGEDAPRGRRHCAVPEDPGCGPILQHGARQPGVCPHSEGRPDKAVEQLREAIRRDPDQAGAHYDLGVALKNKDEIEAAKAELQRSLELDPSLAEAHYMLGIAHWQTGAFDEAAKEMQAAIALRPDYGQAYFMLGTALKQKGDRDGAETALREAIRLDPDDPGPYNTLGQLLRQKGDVEGSKEAFAKGEQVKQAKEAELGRMLQKKDTVK